jgi:hypothetical protein
MSEDPFAELVDDKGGSAGGGAMNLNFGAQPKFPPQ